MKGNLPNNCHLILLSWMGWICSSREWNLLSGCGQPSHEISLNLVERLRSGILPWRLERGRPGMFMARHRASTLIEINALPISHATIIVVLFQTVLRKNFFYQKSGFWSAPPSGLGWSTLNSSEHVWSFCQIWRMQMERLECGHGGCEKLETTGAHFLVFGCVWPKEPSSCIPACIVITSTWEIFYQKFRVPSLLLIKPVFMGLLVIAESYITSYQ